MDPYSTIIIAYSAKMRVMFFVVRFSRPQRLFHLDLFSLNEIYVHFFAGASLNPLYDFPICNKRVSDNKTLINECFCRVAM